MDGADRTAARLPLLPRESLQLVTPYRAPATPIERRVAAIWREVLKLDQVGLDDDFFDLGGDSLTATEIAAAASAAIGVEVQPGRLMTLNTPASLAGFLTARLGAGDTGQASDLPAHVALARQGGPGAPVFMIHGKMGLAFPKPALLEPLGDRHPIYYVSAIGFYDDRPTPTTLEETARAYLASVRQVVPRGSFHLVGMCRGSGIAHEMGRLAATGGDPALSVTLIDPPMSRMSGTRRLPVWADRLRQRLRVSGERIAHRARRAVGLAGSEIDMVADSATMAAALRSGFGGALGDRGMAETMDRAGLRRDRLADVQMTLELMFAGARYRPWDGQVAVLLSASRRARASAAVLEKAASIETLRVIECGHDQIFNAAATQTGTHLAEVIGVAEARGGPRRG